MIENNNSEFNIFTYGTLQPGEKLSYIMAEFYPVKIEKLSIKYFAMGVYPNKKFTFPYLVYTGDEKDIVIGTLYTYDIKVQEDLLFYLDRVETGYDRVLLTQYIEELGIEKTFWMYYFKGLKKEQISSKLLIESPANFSNYLYK